MDFKLYLLAAKAIFDKTVLKKDNGKLVKDFTAKMGPAYVKLAQILANQNIEGIFSEEDRRSLASICDNVNPVDFKKIKEVIESEYGCKLEEKFDSVDQTPIGSASMSQVHRAVLKTGEEVAIKIKRMDITKTLDKDMEQIRKLMHQYGEKFGLKNMVGGDRGLDLYISWIYQESDFENERANIKAYKEFADSVNGKVINTKNIVVPKVYEELCTKNIIVMEHIASQTINQKYKDVATQELSKEDKEQIWKALNSYVQICLYALLNSEEVLFHGDPHSGNVFIDEKGNIGFLDMGLIFKITKEESKFIREFFFAIYNKDEEKIFNMVMPLGNLSETEKIDLKKDISQYKMKIKNKPVTTYFSEMLAICARYNIAPPEYLYTLAKAFVSLYGINTFSENITSAKELLKSQVCGYYAKRTAQDSGKLVQNGFRTVAAIFSSILDNGIKEGVKKEAGAVAKLKEQATQALDGAKEIVDIVGKNVKDTKAYKKTERFIDDKVIPIVGPILSRLKK